MIVVYVFLAIVFLGLAVLVYFVRRFLRRRQTLARLDQVLFLVRLPRTSREGREMQKEVALFEQLLSGLSSTGLPFVFEAAVPHVGEDIHFYVSVPSKLRQTFVRQAYSLWSGAKIEESSEYTIFNHVGFTSARHVIQKSRYILPVRTYRELELDTFSQILGGLAKVDEVGEGAAIQILVRPVMAKRIRKELTRSIEALRKGWKMEDLVRNPLSLKMSDLSRAHAKDEREKEGRHEEGGEMARANEGAIKALEMKAGKQLFHVNVRLVASAPSEHQADEIVNGVAAGFSQFFESPDHNELVLSTPKRARQFIHRFLFREFASDTSMILNVEEIASLFHFPTPFTEIPKLHELRAKQAPPPPLLPKEGTLIGESRYRDEIKPIYITDEDRRRHVYVVGQTGTGKSTLVENMVMEDINHGKGVAVVDPHGELVEHIMRQIPDNRLRDVIIFDPSDLERPLGLNMIEHDPSRPEERTFIVNELISIFDKLYDLKATGGPMFEQYVRNALLLLMEDTIHEPATLMEVARVFTDADFRKRKLGRIANPIVIDFWEKEAEKAGGDAALQNITPYITSKFNTFTANDYMRVIIGQETSSINFRRIMDEKKILLVNLAKGSIGELNSGLLGMIVVGKILLAALGRVDVAEGERSDFALYIDEFQNFTTDSIAVILSEARKYRLNLVIAHQFIAQLTDDIRNAVFGNVGSKITFRVGVQDAEVLVKDFQQEFDEQDLANIDNFHAYASLLIRGETARPFDFATLPPHPGDEKTAQAVRELSRITYGKDREEVEAKIFERLRN